MVERVYLFAKMSIWIKKSWNWRAIFYYVGDEVPEKEVLQWVEIEKQDTSHVLKFLSIANTEGYCYILSSVGDLACFR